MAAPAAPTPPAAEPNNDPVQPPAPVAPAGETVEQQLAAALAKLELVKGDKTRLGQTNAELNARLADLERQMRESQTAVLEDQQQYKPLWEQAKATVATLEGQLADLKTELATEREGQQRERLKTTAMGVFHNAGVIAPEQFFTILGPSIKQADGKTVYLQGGVERDLAAFVETLKTPGSGFEHHFAPSGGRGMSAPAATPTAGGGGDNAGDANNPWTKAGWSRTGQLYLLDKNPEEAQRLMAAAGAK